MSDLSTPPPSALPPAAGAAPFADDAPGFVWPNPPLPCYSPAEPSVGTLHCEIENLAGRAMAGRVGRFDPASGTLHLHVSATAPARVVRFGQFRRLRLMRALQPVPAANSDTLPMGLEDERPVIPYQVVMRNGTTLQGLTARHVETDYGLFLFEPVDQDGAVRRCFIPRAAFERFHVGQRLGEALVEQHMASAEDVQVALAEQEELRARKLGDILVARQIVTREELEAAIEQQANMPVVRIGEALVALGMITSIQLDEALAQQRSDRGTPLGELLVRRGVVSREDLQTALARKMGFPFVDTQIYPFDAEALGRLAYPVARRIPALPLMRRAGRLVVALEDPTLKSAIEEIEFAVQSKIVPVLARVGTLAGAVERAYEQIGRRTGAELAAPTEIESEDASKLLASLEQQQPGAELEATVEESPIEQSDNSLVRLINSMILEAQAQGVSDIHIECQPGRDKVRVRFRKDGQMRPYLELPHTYRSALIARLKIMCDLDISERRKPQDGKITFGRFVPGARLELRVATIPTHSGLEDAVLRLLASAKPLPLDRLNLSPRNFEWIKTAMQKPYGMILCVGPTGSGKTTTLHSAIGYINTPDRKIWTAEDPIEITQPGLRQVQVNPKIDWTFARALRAFLRADPDVVMVGEIRDQETAQIAIEASLTGHLVLSTLHTNSAAETVTRLVDMGMDPFNFADSLLAVLAQRLVRRLCTRCRTSHDASAEEIEELLHDYLHAMRDVPGAPDHDAVLADWRERFGVDGKLVRYHAPGCPACDGSGLKGRAGIHELLTMTRTMRHLIQTGTRSDDLHRAALADGMRTLRQDGIEKVLAGITSLEEVRANSY